MVALQAMAEGFHQPNNKSSEILPDEVPNESVREIIEQYDLGFIRHVDFSLDFVCRNSISESLCSADSPCVIAHKEETLFKKKEYIQPQR
mmetsp:Transcript_21477/g.32492  ORF Transcript_21477/g.32492 Transcript_21477/m.32492 type:complete len:90 (-) Transcript_21477:552-821(-)